jgi:hypothetical protein
MVTCYSKYIETTARKSDKIAKKSLKNMNGSICCHHVDGAVFRFNISTEGAVFRVQVL